MKALLAAFVLLLLVAPAPADDVRPVQVQITEREPELFLVQWRVPQVSGVWSLPEPILPEGSRPEGERVVLEQTGGWLARQNYRCPGGLAGRTVGLRYPLPNTSLTTLFRVELLSGERFARALPPQEDSWQVPEANVGRWLGSLSEARTAVLAGARHGTEVGVHLFFALAIVLLGGAARALRCVTAFAGGQLAAILTTTLLGGSFAPFAAETCVAVAVVFLAREALRGDPAERRLAGLAAAAGLFHGLALDGGAWGELVARVIGMDAALLLLVGVGLAARWLVARGPVARLRPAVTYLTGGGAVALALSTSLERAPAAAAEAASARLPDALSLERPASGSPGSRRIAPASVTAPVQSFLSVEPFEVRHEVLVQLRDVATEVGLVETAEYVEVDAQAGLVQRVAERVAASASLAIDGEPTAGMLERSGFMIAEPTGVLPRREPVREAADKALVGVTFVYLTDGIPEELALTWEGLDGAAAPVPATLVDPESTRSTILTAEQPSLRWTNELLEDPVPRVSGVGVEPRRVPVPLASSALLAAAVVLLLRGRRRAGSSPPWYAGARVALACALFVAPVTPLSIELPESIAGSVSKSEGRRVLASVLPNVYRAFEFREETAVYDRLALAVTGDTLADVYLQHRRALELEERGGARARVEAVEVLDVGEPEPLPDGGFALRATWTVAGSVTHFGHRHFRQNRYDADVLLAPVDGLWKVRTIEVIEQERVR